MQTTFKTVCTLMFFAILPLNPGRIWGNEFSTKPLSEKTFEELIGVHDGVPESNGFRDMLTAMGPLALDRHDFGRTKWEDYPSNAEETKWYQEVWEPICERMRLDPRCRPEFLHWRSLDRFIEIHGITGDEPPLYDPAKYEPEEYEWGDVASVARAMGFCMDVRFPNETFPKLDLDTSSRYTRRLMDQPWKIAEHPQAARWLREVSPLLDLWAAAVRKPQYYSYAPTTREVFFPGEFSVQRELVHAMVIRIMSRIGNGEGLHNAESSNATWSLTDDLMTLYLISRRHNLPRPQETGWLKGSSAEGYGGVCIGRLIQSGLVDDVQLAELERRLDAIPAIPDSVITIDEQEWRAYLALRELPISREEWERMPFSSDGFRYISELVNTPPNRPVVSAIIHQRYDRLREIFRDTDRIRRKEQIEQWKKSIQKVFIQRTSSRLTRFFGTPRKRTEQTATVLVGICMPYDWSLLAEMPAAIESRYRLVRIGIAMQRYRLAHPYEPYPETLETLVAENWITAEKLIDPRNGKSFVYRRGPIYYSITSNRMTETSESTDPSEAALEFKSLVSEPNDSELESTTPACDISDSRSTLLTPFQEWVELPFLLYCIGEDGADQTGPWLDAQIDSRTARTDSHISVVSTDSTSFTRDDLWFPPLNSADAVVLNISPVPNPISQTECSGQRDHQ